jgi:hypothetical protein
MFTVKKITLETISVLTVINFFVGIAHAQSLGLRKVNTTGTPSATRGECLAVIPLLPITEASSTKSLQPFIWVYIIPPEDKDALVALSHTNADDITLESKQERVTANQPKFVRFQLPISNKETQKNQLEANQQYVFKIKCLGSGSSPTVAIKNESDNLKLSSLSFEQRMFEFSKLNLWAESVDSLFDERFICSNRSKGAALFTNLVKNELLVEKVFGKSIGSIEVEKVMIRDFDGFHKSRCKK